MLLATLYDTVTHKQANHRYRNREWSNVVHSYCWSTITPAVWRAVCAALLSLSVRLACTAVDAIGIIARITVLRTKLGEGADHVCATVLRQGARYDFKRFTHGCVRALFIALHTIRWKSTSPCH